MAEGPDPRRLVAVFLLGWLLFHFPLMAIAERAGELFGVPALTLYLFAAWAAIIALLAWLTERKRG